MWAWIIIALVVIGIGVLLERKGPRLGRHARARLHHYEPLALALFSIATGAALLISSYLGYIFAPNLDLTGTIGTALLAVQSVIGALLVLGIFVRLAAVALAGFYLFVVGYFGAVEVIDALIVFGISLALIISGRPRLRITKWKRIDEWTKRYHDYAIPILRIITGINLVVLGLSEKILHPELGMAFLAEHHWNFMAMLGFAGFTDYWFVFSAGIVEVLLGVIFILGIATRINTIVLAAFFIATIILLGPLEVTGHLMHFAIVATFLVFGSGRKLKVL